MNNLIEPLGEETEIEIDEYISALQEAHHYLVAKYRQHMEQMYRGQLKPTSTFGRDVKRNKVYLSGDDKPTMVGSDAQSIVEIINQLANIERLIDALIWARDNGATTVMQCNPTTSSEGHDLVVSGSGGVSVFEISDTMSTYGEAKVKNDLNTLFDCECDYCRKPHKSFIVISEEASEYLPKDDYETSKGNLVHSGQVHVLDMPGNTHIAEFYK
jgi:hypothetical protein